MAATDFKNLVKIDGPKALFEGKVEGLIALSYQNERPLQGLAGLLDWRFNGVISKFVKEGKVTGEEGECVYIPIKRNNKIYHLVLAGAGFNSKPGARKKAPKKTLLSLKKNLELMKLEKMGISSQDFGENSKEYFQKEFGSIPLWIVQ